MIDHLANLLALRAVAASLTVATTGATTLASTVNGYTRTAGSFLTDGFAVGMEVVPTGFVDTTAGLVTAVTALQLTIRGGRGVEAGAAGRSLVCGLPERRGWEGIELSDLEGRWRVDEDYLPGPARIITIGRFGQVEYSPMYVLKVYAPGGFGVAGSYKVADGLLRVFPPQLAMPLSSGDVLRVRGDPAPYRGQLMASGGKGVIVVTVPLWLRTANSI